MAKRKKRTTEDFIKLAKEVHGDKYDYSKVNYVTGDVKVCIICPEHGEFWQVPSSHLRGFGCAKCSGCGHLNTQEFIERARKIHGDKYDYSKVEYKNSKTKICIICPEHGEFWQVANEHLQGKGCASCANTKKYTTEEFVEKCKKIYGDKYDYSKVNYTSAHEKVCIICPKHGEFWQTPDNHYRWGCKHCQESSMEKEMELFLSENKIVYEKQKRFEWLVYKKEMALDFYLPEYNVAIECQGDQHFNPFRYKGGDKRFELRKDRDLVKSTLCNKYNLKLYYYNKDEKYNELNGIKIYHDIITLIKDIQNDSTRI